MNRFFQSLVAVLFLGLMSSVPAQASLMTVSAFFDGDNDCSGFFGQGFGSCQIFINDNGERIELSPVIIKFDGSLGVEEINGEAPAGFPSVEGSEWTFSNQGAGNGTGDWTYVPTGDDPGIRYWAAKAANGFNLFWTIQQALAAPCTGTSTNNDNYNLACLNLAEVVAMGDWITPLKQNGSARDLSHLTFYNSEPPTVVPVPAAVWLFGTALLGFAGMSRRVKV